MTFDDYDIDRLREKIDGLIMNYMPAADGYSAEVRHAMNYAVSTGGKRLRPMLMYLTFNAMGGSGDIINPFMAAIEMIHTESLIHDDLPAIDNDSLRHGKPTVHKKFGEDIAILSGDALLNLAYETAAKAFTMKPGDKAVERAFFLLASKSGIHGMLGGQSADVILTGKSIDAKEMRYIYQKKTASLIECPMMIGAILAGATEEEIADIKQAGRDLGLAFQVQDDILDIISTSDQIGKEVHQDERNQKMTYASVHGVDESKKYVNEKTDMVLERLSKVIDENGNKYAKLLKKLIHKLAGREI